MELKDIKTQEDLKKDLKFFSKISFEFSKINSFASEISSKLT